MTIEYAKKIIRTEYDAIRNLEKVLESDNKNFTSILNTLEKTKGRIITCGVGKAGQIATKIAATLASTGSISFFLHPAEAFHGDLGMVHKEDTVLLFSNSGTSLEVTKLVPYIKNIGAKTIAITGNNESLLATKADNAISYGNIEEACPLGLAPTATTTAMLVLGDVIALCLMERKKFNIQDYAKFHPGGALGKQTALTKDIATKIEDIATVSPETTIKETIIKVTEKSAGGAVIIDENQNLISFFSDGDLRRLLNNNQSLDAKIKTVIKKGCCQIEHNKYASDAMSIMKEKNIGELPVTKDGKLIGLITLKNLA